MAEITSTESSGGSQGKGWMAKGYASLFKKFGNPTTDSTTEAESDQK